MPAPSPAPLFTVAPPAHTGAVRPEDRCRSGGDSGHREAWADTHPACLRSEGFAEDLPELPSTRAGAPPEAAAAAAGSLLVRASTTARRLLQGIAPSVGATAGAWRPGRG